ncbi:hypothetical protein Hanom_Chr02g00151441 [Helianthus anomalus]
MKHYQRIVKDNKIKIFRAYVLGKVVSFRVIRLSPYPILLVNVWEKWFTRLYVWDGIPPLFERVAWVKVLGVPVSLWDGHIVNRIGERCGRLLVKSEAEVAMVIWLRIGLRSWSIRVRSSERSLT